MSVDTYQTAPASLFSRLEPLLARVAKPVQYIGGEVNSQPKPFEQAEVRWVLMYPDAYEVGQPNQGLAILYELLNERDWICAERSYTIWPDLAGLMRAEGIPQFTLENHLPVAAFDVFGLSFSTELCYTNMLESLDLAGIPLHAADRGLDLLPRHRPHRRCRRRLDRIGRLRPWRHRLLLDLVVAARDRRFGPRPVDLQPDPAPPLIPVPRVVRTIGRPGDLRF